jgi:hypothetical protein
VQAVLRLVAERMRQLLAAVFLLSIAACKSAEEKQRALDSAMVEQAKLDAAAELEFLEDSVKLAQSISADTVADLIMRRARAQDDNGYEYEVNEFLAVAPSRTRCIVDSVKYIALVRGDTLSCQWGPPE